MSMHLRGSRDMMGNQEEEGWWKSRTGLEQKLLILSTLLFILSFGLTISVIVLKSKTCPTCPEISTTTEAFTGSTESSTETTPETPITSDATVSTDATATEASPTVSSSETSVSVSEPSSVSAPASSTTDASATSPKSAAPEPSTEVTQESSPA